MESALAELLRQREAVNVGIRRATERLRAARRRAHATGRRRTLAEVLTKNIARTVYTLYVISDFDASVPLTWLERRAREGQIDRSALLGLRGEDIAASLVVAFPDGFLDLTHPESATARRRLQRCHEYFCELKLFKWVLELNSRKGVAPSTSHLVERYLSTWPVGVHALAPPSLQRLLARPFSVRMWAVRWRRRWGVRHGKLKIRTVCAEAEMCQKERGSEPVFGSHF